MKFAEIDPRLVHWKTVEVTYDDATDPSCTHLAIQSKKVLLMIALMPHLLNLIKRQQSAIETLEVKLPPLRRNQVNFTCKHFPAVATPTTTFTWAVGTMDRQLSNGAVQTMHYTVTANDGTYESGAYCSVGLDQPEDDCCRSDQYADLTENWAVAMCSPTTWWYGEGC